MCNLPVDPGPCRGAFRKYYYEPGLRTCHEFIYGGCDGNANRFSTIAECESICVHHEEPVPPGNDTSVSNLCTYTLISLYIYTSAPRTRPAVIDFRERGIICPSSSESSRKLE